MVKQKVLRKTLSDKNVGLVIFGLFCVILCCTEIKRSNVRHQEFLEKR